MLSNVWLGGGGTEVRPSHLAPMATDTWCVIMLVIQNVGHGVWRVGGCQDGNMEMP